MFEDTFTCDNKVQDVICRIIPTVANNFLIRGSKIIFAIYETRLGLIKDLNLESIRSWNSRLSQMGDWILSRYFLYRLCCVIFVGKCWMFVFTCDNCLYNKMFWRQTVYNHDSIIYYIAPSAMIEHQCQLSRGLFNNVSRQNAPKSKHHQKVHT